ncbi:MAG: NAD(P)-dependent alcohol dehydrogenase [Gammaproteobacteria bacterium]|nr:NAD(P)-dependent alcohol dehydrogenase [Gammaproteobacteria bacterium]
MKVFEIVQGSTSLDGLRLAERPKPSAGPGQVLVRIRAVSLNYRDLAVVQGKYFGGAVPRNLIPLSDGAGEVEAVGDGVTAFAPGDRVVATFTQGSPPAALGSPLDGTLAEHVVFPESGLLKIPEHLSFEEAATLPCAGVTAWNALMEGKITRPGDTVLTLGTGGVSILALQIAKAAGARVIVTSSSDEKLARAKALGADATINYRRTPNWDQEVLALTSGRGADHIVEVGGAGTLPRSLHAVAQRGEIVLIGVLTPPSGDLNPHALMPKNATLRGVFVGDKPMFEALMRAIEVNRIHPVVDQVFDFESAPDAYRRLQSAQHFGKLVIRV